MKNLKNNIVQYLGLNLNEIFNKVSDKFLSDVEEIKIKVGKPIIINKKNKEYSINIEGEIIENILYGYRSSENEIKKTIELMTGHSLYAFEEEIGSGYLTLPGGHRVGITGKIIYDKDKIITIKNINGLNIRISHEILNCSRGIIDYVVCPYIFHTLIISPPACGKTTILRDLIKNISNGIEGEFRGQTVGLVDERSEIAGCYLGVPQNDVGIRTDVLDACPKYLGMKILLRSMSPKVIAVDEIGGKEDIEAIDEIINAGIKLIATVHGSSINNLRKRKYLNELLERKYFERYIILGYKELPGAVLGIFDKDFKRFI